MTGRSVGLLISRTDHADDDSPPKNSPNTQEVLAASVTIPQGQAPRCGYDPSGGVGADKRVIADGFSNTLQPKKLPQFSAIDANAH